MALQEELEKQGNFLFKYRGVVPVVFLMAGIGAFIQTGITKSGIHDPQLHDIYWFACLLISFIGFGIRVHTVGHTPRNTSGRNTEGQLADELNTTGIYSTVRHPLYVGNFFMWLGVAMLAENIWFMAFFVFLYWVYYERIMFAEEQYLRNKFGNIYLDWAKKTPAFIPSFKHRTPSKLSFSWKKVLKKEKNGFFTLFLVYFLFKCIENIINGAELIKTDWLFICTVSSIIIYLILKFIKKFTGLLDEEGR